jgi:hypothetical protein
MTAEQLIKLLADLPPKTIIFVWHDGERYPICESTTVDFWDVFHADINVEHSK